MYMQFPYKPYSEMQDNILNKFYTVHFKFSYVFSSDQGQGLNLKTAPEHVFEKVF